MTLPGGSFYAPSKPIVGPRASPAALAGEFVAAGGSFLYRNTARALPWAIDDLAHDLGDDIYEKMLFDSQVAACLTVFKAAILEEGVELSPAIDDETDERYRLSTEISDAAEAMLDGLVPGLDDVLWDMCDALAFGHRVAEQVFDVADGPDGPRLNLVKFKTKPRRTTAFVVDAFLNVLGLIGARPGQQLPTGFGSVMSLGNLDQSAATLIIPREKFAVLTFRPRNGDPRGSSLLRPCYDPWWRKRQILPEYLRFLSVYAVPMLIGFTPQQAQDRPETDALGNVIEVAAGQVPGVGQTVARKTPEQAMAEALMQARNGAVMAFPEGATVQVSEAKGDGRAFHQALAECDIAITKAMLTQSLATEEGEHQARAAAQVHQDVFQTLVRTAKRAVVRMVREDVLAPWVSYNWGDDARELVPVVDLGTVDNTDVVGLMNAISNLSRSGYLDPSQLPDVDRMAGLPVRDLTAAPVDAPIVTGEQPQGQNPAEPSATESTKTAGEAVEMARHSLLPKAELDRLAKVGPADIRAAAAYWRRKAPRKLRGLIDARPIP